jgi:hypothetical protein
LRRRRRHRGPIRPETRRREEYDVLHDFRHRFAVTVLTRWYKM